MTERKKPIHRSAVLFVWLVSAGSTTLFGASCRPPAPATLVRVQGYVAKQLHLPLSEVTVSVRPSRKNAICFSDLLIHTKSQAADFDLFLSSDGRFVASELYDLRVDPLVEEKRHERAVAERLKQGAIKISGSDAPGVPELVVFEDFQCPFCRQYRKTIAAALAGRTSGARILYRAYPLSIHPWAFPAAIMAACVNLQKPSEAGALSEYIFDNQDSISTSNVTSKLRDFLEQREVLKMSLLDTCLSDGSGKKLVEADISLGNQEGVNSTPTTFVNGRRVQGILTSEALRKLLDQKESLPGEAPKMRSVGNF
jgi:protein-disulfide isomerase